MLLAKLAASRSTCLSRPTGATIVKDKRVLSTGYNGSMPGVPHCIDEGQCYRRKINASDDGKYDFCRSIHAEANAIAQAAKLGIDINGATVYVTLMPCYVCTKLMASAGIKKVYFELSYESINSDRDKLWAEAIKDAGIEFEKLTIPPETIEMVLPFLSKITSERRPEST
jgi:dCMP deaminase